MRLEHNFWGPLRYRDAYWVMGYVHPELFPKVEFASLLAATVMGLSPVQHIQIKTELIMEWCYYADPGCLTIIRGYKK